MKKTISSNSQKIIKILEEVYNEELKSGLKFNNSFELLLATILSAQTTDNQVNKVTGTLFRRYSTPEEFAVLTPEDIEPLIKGCGLYKNKSKNIIKTCRTMVEKYNSCVPDTLEELMKLPGVGRKTANVVLSVAFGKPAIAVDTHVFRVSKRLGFAEGDTTEKVEKELLEIVPPEKTTNFHFLLINHGRRICRARNPRCSECAVNNLCPSYVK